MSVRPMNVARAISRKCGCHNCRNSKEHVIPKTQAAIEILKSYLNDDSRIVRTFAMDSLAHFVEDNPTLEPWIISLIEELVEDGSPAMRARGRKLLNLLKVIGRED